MRYRLRTLLILMAVLPPLLSVGWLKYAAWKAEQERLRAAREMIISIDWTVDYSAVWDMVQKQNAAAGKVSGDGQESAPLPEE